jgi:hypothetical protein
MASSSRGCFLLVWDTKGQSPGASASVVLSCVGKERGRQGGQRQWRSGERTYTLQDSPRCSSVKMFYVIT